MTPMVETTRKRDQYDRAIFADNETPDPFTVESRFAQWLGKTCGPWTVIRLTETQHVPAASVDGPAAATGGSCAGGATPTPSTSRPRRTTRPAPPLGLCLYRKTPRGSKQTKETSDGSKRRPG